MGFNRIFKIILSMFVFVHVVICGQEANVQTYNWDMRFVEEPQSSLDSTSWSFSSTALSNQIYNIRAYVWPDSAIVCEDGHLYRVHISEDSLLLSSVEDRLVKLRFDKCIQINGDINVSHQDQFSAKGLYCDRLAVETDGCILKSPNKTGILTIDNDTLRNVYLTHRVIEYMSHIYVDSLSKNNWTNNLISKDIYEWFNSKSNFPLARYIQTSCISDHDTTVISSMALLADQETIEEAILTDSISTHKARSKYINQFNAQFPQTILVTPSPETSDNVLNLNFTATDNNTYNAVVEVFNLLGQQIAPSFQTEITGVATSKAVHLMPTNANVFLIVVHVGDAIKTYKISK